MATANLGRVGIVNKGAYVGGVTVYKVNDIVKYTNSVYICIQAHSTENLPTNINFWTVWLDATDIVHITGTESISGVKTFTTQPVGIVKASVELGNVDNTSDLLKPLSNADIAALALKISKDSDTGAAFLPSGTTAQRPATPVNGYIRYNSDLLGMEAYANGIWGSVGGGATGGLTDKVFQENDQVVNNSYTLGVGKNASSVGPITINTGVNVTVPAGANWVIL